MKNIEWLSEIKPKLKNFLTLMNIDNYSYIKYSLSGDNNKNYKEWGLGNLVFTVKILYISGLINELNVEQKQNLYNSIIKFSKNDSQIFDNYISGFTFKEKLLNIINSNNKRIENKINTQRAETRQSFAALHLLDKTPMKPYKLIPYTESDIEKYLNSFNWNTPWAAGSHFSHLLFFLYYNSEILNFKKQNSSVLIQDAINIVNRLQNKDDGCWYAGENITLSEKINGAMKILTGLHAANVYDIQYPKKLIDTALSGINDSEACSNFNIVYVLYGATKVEPNYRKNEIAEFLINRLNLYKEFYYEEIGGFSFNKKKANDIYYGKKITIGKDEPDIHGTIMFVWGISIINSILNLGLNYKIPIN